MVAVEDQHVVAVPLAAAAEGVEFHGAVDHAHQESIFQQLNCQVVFLSKPTTYKRIKPKLDPSSHSIYPTCMNDSIIGHVTRHQFLKTVCILICHQFITIINKKKVNYVKNE